MCPFGVGYGRGLEAARTLLAERRGFRPLARLVLGVFARRAAWRTIFRAARWLRGLGLAQALAGPRRFGMAMLAATTPARAATPSAAAPPSRRAAERGPGSTVALFRGCVMDELFGHVHDATRRTLEANGYTVLEAPGQGFCGALHAHAGDPGDARALPRAELGAFAGRAGVIVGDRARGGARRRDPGMTMRSMADGLVPSEMSVRINVNKPYTRYIEPNDTYVPEIPTPGVFFRNDGLPLYKFNTGDQATLTAQIEVAKTACDLIDGVPNPYYAYSGYETGRLDNRVKFINLPQVCTISIYNVSGTLVRKFRKDNSLTYLDWDLRNSTNATAGVYICHIDVPGVCERVVKWFGAMRPVDLQNF